MVLGFETSGSGEIEPAVVLIHGLTFDRRHWGPVVSHLTRARPEQLLLSVDLPGHGTSPRWAEYDISRVVDAVHEVVTDRELDAPVLVGHSIGAVVATVYAARYPAGAVVNIDQPLPTGPFQEVLRQVEPVLRSSDYLSVWQQLLAGMGVDTLPPDARDLVLTASTPRQDLLLGYWSELLASDEDPLVERNPAVLAALRDRAVPYRYIVSEEPSPRYLEWLRSQLPQTEITVVPGTGHFPHLAGPADVAAAVLDVARPRAPR